MKVSITHTTRIAYGAHVVEGVMDVRLGPRSDADQRWQEYDLRATPSAAIRRYYDGFGNAAHLVTIARVKVPGRNRRIVLHRPPIDVGETAALELRCAITGDRTERTVEVPVHGPRDRFDHPPTIHGAASPSLRGLVRTFRGIMTTTPPRLPRRRR